MYTKLNSRIYNLIIGLILLWGFGLNAVFCMFGTPIFQSWNPMVILICYFVSAISGVMMTRASDNPMISFIGYNLVVLPLGVVLSIYLPAYYTETIFQAFVVTSIVTVIMIIIATIRPTIFERLAPVLFISLIGVVITELVLWLCGVAEPQWWDYIVAIIFCGYIGYDWQKAQKKEKTLDGAVDSATDLYLDIINLFLRLLGNKKKD